MKYFISRKDRIILSAIDIINELGIQGLSTKELAFRQGVNESALYRHFKNKDAIIEGVLEYFSQFDNSIYNSTIEKNLNGREKILDYIKAYLEYYEGYPAITAILFSYESLSHDQGAKEKMNLIFGIRLKNIIFLLDECQKNNEITQIIPARELALILIGYCNKVILEWRIGNFSYSFKDDTIKTIEKLLSIID